MKTIVMNMDESYNDKVPDDFTGIIEYPEVKYKGWHKNGDYHRVDGPARIREDDVEPFVQYWLNGVELTKEEWVIQTKVLKTSVGKLIYGETNESKI